LRRSSLCASGAALALLGAGCGARPQQAVGVSRGPTVHELVCDARTVVVRHPDATPPFTVRNEDGDPVMRVTTVPASGILRADGRVVTAAQFLDGRDGYCNSARQDRAAALAAGFAGVVLALAYLVRRRRLRRAYR
jgi:hypothetical protein